MSSSSTGAPSAKRAKISLKTVKFQSRGDRAQNAHAPVVTSVFNWGRNASLYFEGVGRSCPLWQVQVVHEAHNGIAYGMNNGLKEALPHFGGGVATTLETMEQVHKIRYTNTGGRTDTFDRDEVGHQVWRCALYVGSPTFHPVLELLKIVVDRYVESGRLLMRPDLVVVGVEPSHALPDGWVVRPAVSPVSPFFALPPKGRRHVLAQVEQAEVCWVSEKCSDGV